MCANLLLVKCFRLLPYDWDFGKCPSTIPKCSNNFPKTYCNVVENDGRFSDDYKSPFKRQQLASLSSLNDFQSVVGTVRGSAATVKIVVNVIGIYELKPQLNTLIRLKIQVEIILFDLE